MALAKMAVLVAACGLASSALAQVPAPGQLEPVVRYDGHRAVRVSPKTARELSTVRALADDILTCEANGMGPGTFDIRVGPDKFAALATSGVAYQVLINDIQQHVDQIFADDARIRAEQLLQDDPAWFVTYRSLAEIETRLGVLATNFPNLATLSNVSTTVQGRQIKMIRVTGPDRPGNPRSTRPAVVVQGNQHAREWVTPMSVMYIVDRLLETYATDARIRNLVDKIDFYIIPTANPDGYEYSRTTNSQWRKNRRDNPSTSCDGVDLNRNWGHQWGFDNVGSSGDPCSETYRGSAGFSEPELAGIKSLVDTLAAQGKYKVHWDVHANAQMILSPWGYTTAIPSALPQMNALGLIIQNGMRTVRNTVYPYGEGSVILYLNNGNTRDYGYGVHGAMGWTVEMDGVSFQPAVSEILPIAQECLAGLVPLAEQFIVAPACYANCDGSSVVPALNALDFSCFLNRYTTGQPYANCDNSTSPPTLNALDFSCFLGQYLAGCP